MGFNFTPDECDYEFWGAAGQESLDNGFQECVGKPSCKFTFNNTGALSNVAEKCKLGKSNAKSWQYSLIAECSEKTITILGNRAWTVDRSAAAVVVVMFDLLVAFVLWISMVALKPILAVSEKEIEDNAITASDFTVTIECPKTESSL